MREERITFDFAGIDQVDRVPKAAGPSSRGLQRLLLCVLLVLMLMAAIILAFPLSESFQRLASLIHPPPR